MNLSYFISKRISQAQSGGFSTVIHKIAIVSIAIGLAAAIVSFLIMKGFKETVENKVYSFSAHLNVTKYTLNNSTEEQPFDFNIDFYNNPGQFKFVDHVQEYTHKPGLIRTENEILGVVLKGIGQSFDLARFKENIIEGRFIQFNDTTYAKEVLLSKTIADKLDIKLGDDVVVHFFQNPPRFRKLKLVGIYETNLSDYFDNKIIIGDIKMVQRLNNWSDSTAGGLQIYLKQHTNVEEAATTIGESMDYDLFIEKVSDKYNQVFEWLGLISRQVDILLVIILIVVCVNMISVILILVMERTSMIGLLKALGGTDKFIQSIFIYNGINLIAKGLLWGNVVGLGVCLVQYQFHLFKLNARDYYVSYVPIGWDWQVVVGLNFLVFLVVALILVLPTAMISKISPIKAIRID